MGRQVVNLSLPRLYKHSISLFGHIARLDDIADAKKIVTALPPEDWKRLPGAFRSHG